MVVKGLPKRFRLDLQTGPAVAGRERRGALALRAAVTKSWEETSPNPP